ncbi:hypothetical protein SAMD00019534_012670 [Acytostelium subglobosum LB1]|uniref:hypothetical protein n=1 Tax=Acytostelium subglobosum LB1 TaxID=1410327 RepID=UPI000644AF19|nr:hypothetical protein SAMD00019534_012670 [Acytostelium subglobosum LB1]GAM18092.1 hypothetical protein SAMD00019534_012670 [Acytostelium subglobosum LB1]|eukprot:XP_012758688.1 hypothetical protein SAMD00019534_012670 [Acytostelium subglobosum LB1]
MSSLSILKFVANVAFAFGGVYILNKFLDKVENEEPEQERHKETTRIRVIVDSGLTQYSAAFILNVLHKYQQATIKSLSKPRHLSGYSATIYSEFNLPPHVDFHFKSYFVSEMILLYLSSSKSIRGYDHNTVPSGTPLFRVLQLDGNGAGHNKWKEYHHLSRAKVIRESE